MQAKPEMSVLEWLKEHLRPQRTAQTSQPKTQTVSGWRFALGLLLALCGQYLLLFPARNFPDYALADWLEISLRLSMPDLKAQLVGAGLLLSGALLILSFARERAPLAAENNPGGKLSLPLGLKIFSSWQFITSVALNIFLLVQLLRQDAGNYLALAWLASLLPVAGLAWRLDRQAGVPLSPNLGRRDLAAMLLVGLAGLMVGAYRLTGVPNFLMGDEGSFWTTARDIVTGIYRPSIFDFGVYTYPILSSYFQAWVISWGGLSLWGWRLSSLVAGLLSVPALYLLARELFNPKIALLSIVALVFSPYFLAFSRFGYNNSQTLLPVTLTLALGYLGLKRSSLFYLLLAGYAAGLGFYTYTAAQSGLLILGLFIFILLLQKRGQRRQVLLAGLTVLFGWYLMVSPHRVYGMVKNHESFQVKLGESIFFNANYAVSFARPGPDGELPGTFFGPDESFYFDGPTWLMMSVRGAIRSLMVFQTPTLVGEHMIAAPLAGSAGSLFFLVGMVSSLLAWRERRNKLLLCWHVFTLLSLSILNTFPPRQTHLVGLTPLLALWIGLGIDWLARALGAALNPLAQPRGQAVLLTALMTLTAGFGLRDYFVVAPETYRPQEENVINWAALYNPDARFLFVAPPERETFKPFVFREIQPQIAYQAVSPSNLAAALAENPQMPTVVYFPVSIAEAIRLLPPGWAPAEAYIHTSREGFPILYAVANISNFRYTVPYGFMPFEGDAFGGPALALAALLLALAVLVIFFPRAWLVRLPGPMRQMAQGIAAPPVSLAAEEPVLPAAAVKSLETAPQAPGASAPPLTTAEAPGAPDSSSETAQESGRFIEIEFKVRINLGNKTRVWPTSGWRADSLRKPLQTWLSSLTRSDWASGPLPSASLLGLALLLAFAAQFVMNARISIPASAAYLAVIGIILFWMRKNSSSVAGLVEIGPLHPNKTWLLALVVLGLGIFARTYQAGNFPYGIEGDESKWGLQAFYSVILQASQGIFGHHFEHQPVSFYLIGLAMRVWEIDLLSPRYLNAVLSSLSLVFFFFALRKAANPSVGLAGTFLYAVSFSALSAGRQALHDTYIEIWANLAFLALVYGLENRKTWQLLVAGVALALGSLTYETFYPLVVIFLLYAAFKLWQERREWRQTVWMGLALIFPLAVAGPQVIDYILLRQEYHLGAFRTASAGNPDVNPLISGLQTGWNFATQAAESLFVSVVYPDSLTRWSGPLVNPWILPFFVIGLAIALRQRQKSHYQLLLLWFFVGFFGFSALGAGFPRVLFAALMPVYALAGLGLVAALNTARSLRSLSAAGTPRLLAGFALLLLFLGLYDARVFLNLPDLPDRQQRRELYDTFSTSLRSTPTTLLAYSSRFENVISLEANTLEMLAAGIFDLQKPPEAYQTLPMENVMTALWQRRERAAQVSLVIDKQALQEDNAYAQGLKTLLACYPEHTRIEGQHFERYLLSGLQKPTCFSLPAPTLSSPTRESHLKAGKPIRFEWLPVADAQVEIHLQALQEGLVRLEAEQMQADGWYPEDRLAADFSGQGYLTDNFNAGLAQTSFEISAPGEYTLWVRTYRRKINDQVNYLALDNNPPVQIAQGGEESFNTWLWESLGPYFLTEGRHTLTASRVYGTEPQFSVFLDVFVLSPDPNYDPRQAEEWHSIFSSRPLDGRLGAYIYTPGLPAGQYRWWISFAQTPGLVNWLGASGISTEPVEFTIQSQP